jgi:hypothetical protein
VKPKTLRRALRLSILDGCAYSIMVGGAESFLTAFAVFLGVPSAQVGLLSSVPLLVGSSAQLLTPAGVRLLGGLKPWVVTLAYAQGAVLAATALVPRLGIPPFLALLILLSGYWTLNLAIGPAWNHWMGVLVPGSRRAAFFSRRNRVLHVCVLAGLLAGGAILDRAARAGATAIGFIAIVVGGGVMRLISATFLAFQAAPPAAKELKRAESFWTFLRRLPSRRESGLLPFLWMINFAVAIGSPYFVPYMLRDLKMSYWTFMAVTGTAFLAKSATMGIWARAARRLGSRRAFMIAACLIVPAPALWSLAHSVPYLMLLQVLAGSAWAGFELCQLLLFYDLVEERRLSDVFSYYSVVNGIGQVAGAALGGFLLTHPVYLTNGYLEVFVISSLTRLLPLLILVGTLQRLTLRHAMPRGIILRVVGLLPEWESFVNPLWWRPGRVAAGRRPRPARRATTTTPRRSEEGGGEGSREPRGELESGEN